MNEWNKWIDGWMDHAPYTVMTTAMLKMCVLQIARRVQAINACKLKLNLLHFILKVYCHSLKPAYCKHTKSYCVTQLMLYTGEKLSSTIF